MAERTLQAADFARNKNHYFPGEAHIAVEELETPWTSIPTRSIYTEAGVEFGSNVDFVEAEQAKLSTGAIFTLRRDVKKVDFMLSFVTREVYFASWNIAQGGTLDDSATLGGMSGKQVTVDGKLPPNLQFRIVMQQPDTSKYIIITIPNGQSMNISNLTKDDYYNIPCEIHATIDPEDETTYPTIFFES